MNAEQYQKLLTKLGACHEARHSANNKSLEEVWSTCERGDWLLWLAAKINIDRKLIVGICCDIAEKTLCHVPANEKRPSEVIRIARAWINGEATIEQVLSAAYAASAAAANAAYAAATYAAYASASATYAANAAYASERNKSLMESANYVRSKIQFSSILNAANAVLESK